MATTVASGASIAPTRNIVPTAAATDSPIPERCDQSFMPTKTTAPLEFAPPARMSKPLIDMTADCPLISFCAACWILSTTFCV